MTRNAQRKVQNKTEKTAINKIPKTVSQKMAIHPSKRNQKPVRPAISLTKVSHQNLLTAVNPKKVVSRKKVVSLLAVAKTVRAVKVSLARTVLAMNRMVIHLTQDLRSPVVVIRAAATSNRKTNNRKTAGHRISKVASRASQMPVEVASNRAVMSESR